MRRPRAASWGLAGAAIVLLVLLARHLLSNRFRDGAARSPSPASDASGPEATAMEWVRRGNAAIQRRRLKEAEAELERAKQLDLTLVTARLG